MSVYYALPMEIQMLPKSLKDLEVQVVLSFLKIHMQRIDGHTGAFKALREGVHHRTNRGMTRAGIQR